MAHHRIVSFRSSKQAVATNVVRARNSALDVAKWLGLGFTGLGVLAWITGTSYLSGYWSAANWVGPLAGRSVQEVALNGFSGPTKIWENAAYSLLGMVAVLVLFVTVKLQGPKKDKKIQIQQYYEGGFIIEWISGRYLGLRASLILIPMYVFSIACLVLISLFILWIEEARQLGSEAFIKERCRFMVNSTIELDNGRLLVGEAIERFGSEVVMIDDKCLYAISVGNGKKLLETVKLPPLKCPPP